MSNLTVNILFIPASRNQPLTTILHHTTLILMSAPPMQWRVCGLTLIKQVLLEDVQLWSYLEEALVVHHLNHLKLLHLVLHHASVPMTRLPLLLLLSSCLKQHMLWCSKLLKSAMVVSGMTATSEWSLRVTCGLGNLKCTTPMMNEKMLCVLLSKTTCTKGLICAFIPLPIKWTELYPSFQYSSGQFPCSSGSPLDTPPELSASEVLQTSLGPYWTLSEIKGTILRWGAQHMSWGQSPSELVILTPPRDCMHPCAWSLTGRMHPWMAWTLKEVWIITHIVRFCWHEGFEL